jgi:hypothetical protein
MVNGTVSLISSKHDPWVGIGVAAFMLPISIDDAVYIPVAH